MWKVEEGHVLDFGMWCGHVVSGSTNLFFMKMLRFRLLGRVNSPIW